jgi:hypothetical protein
MKRTLLIAALSLASVAGSAFGATPKTVTASVPYRFVANGVDLPAGRYQVDIYLNRVRLVSENGSTIVDIPAAQLRSAQLRVGTDLIMKRKDGRMYLLAVRDSGFLRMVGSDN